MKYLVVKFQSGQVEIISDKCVTGIGRCVFPDDLEKASALAKGHADKNAKWKTYKMTVLKSSGNNNF